MIRRLEGGRKIRVPTPAPGCQDAPVIIRRERPDDVDAIREVHLAAFANPRGRQEPVAPEDTGTPPPDPVEARLVDDLRADTAAWLPELSLVAVGHDGEIVGHVVCTRGRVAGVDGEDGEDGEDGNAGGTPALGLGPIGVLPDRQAAGVGSALMHAVLGAADALGEPLVALLGDPAYYRWFGFVTATGLGVRPPVEAWGEHFQVRTLTAWDATRHTGRFAYAAPFDGL
jgi:putative acetyltransferase